MNKLLLISRSISILLLAASQFVMAENLKDVNKWLKKLDNNTPTQAFPRAVSSLAFGSEDIRYQPALEKPTTSIDDYYFQEEYEKITRINRKNLINSLEKRFKIYLINYKRDDKRHRTHFNILERKLVTKGRHGGNRYELRITQEKYRAKYSFSFY